MRESHFELANKYCDILRDTYSRDYEKNIKKYGGDVNYRSLVAHRIATGRCFEEIETVDSLVDQGYYGYREIGNRLCENLKYGNGEVFRRRSL